MKRLFHRLFHFWKLFKDTGINRYYQCDVCGDRVVVMGRFGFQPMNRRWLEGGEWDAPPAPLPRGGSGDPREGVKQRTIYK